MQDVNKHLNKATIDYYKELAKNNLMDPYKEIRKFQFLIKENEILILDWEHIIADILKDIELKKDTSYIAIKFHNTISEICNYLRKITKINKVALSGGVFQNKLLSELVYKKLKGFKVYQHNQVSSNDGRISLSQAAIASF